MTIKYPNIKVQLTGTDGNAYSIIGKVAKALKRGGVSGPEVSEFTRKSMSGNYDNVLQTAMRWVDVS